MSLFQHQIGSTLDFNFLDSNTGIHHLYLNSWRKSFELSFLYESALYIQSYIITSFSETYCSLSLSFKMSCLICFQLTFLLTKYFLNFMWNQVGLERILVNVRLFSVILFQFRKFLLFLECLTDNYPNLKCSQKRRIQKNWSFFS
jgi:uncharacterized membrane protein YhdT